MAATSLNSMFSPIASTSPVTSTGVNPTTGATYSKIQPTAATGTSPAGGSTLATYNPTTVASADPTNPNSGTYAPGTYSNTGNGTLNDYNGSIYAGNGTFGALGTDAPTGGIGNTSGGSSATTGTGPAAGTADSASSGAATAAAAEAAASPTYGTQSGPGVLDQWFNERASGTDPGWEYANGRAMTSLNNQEAARGGYNGGAGVQQDSDLLANETSQRETELDQLAAGASGENQATINSMFGTGTSLASGAAGTGAAYDTSGANAMSGANTQGLGYGAQGTALTYGANSNLMNQLFGVGTLAALA